MIKAGAAESFWQAVRFQPDAFPNLGLAGSARNIVAVTIGNILGGAVFVAGVYWLLYRRPRPSR